jgi:hypothetical protein
MKSTNIYFFYNAAPYNFFFKLKGKISKYFRKLGKIAENQGFLQKVLGKF